MPIQQSPQERVFDRLAALGSESSRIKFAARLHLLSPSTVERLDEAVSVLARVDLKKARELAEAAVTIANKLGDLESQGYALRAKANALAFVGDNRNASQLHARAVACFEEAGKITEVGRTLSSSIQPLILLGEYDLAHAAADKAREIFSAARDPVRLARLGINVGNIFHRQDRFREALDCYEQAYALLLPDKDAEGIIAALHNIAMCLTMLNEYEKALDAYQQVRKFCVEQAKPLAVAQAEYNIAYLYYLRGRYGRAIEMLHSAHEAAEKAGDGHRAALCLLDLSEIYLELNFNQEAEELAQQAFTSFERLGMGYEAAKALCQSATALSQRGKIFRALVTFAQARMIFVKEKNQVWVALIDLYQALAYYHDGRIEESRLSCLAAMNFFRDSQLPGKAILCRLLLARLSLKQGEIAAARQECQAALAELTGRETPVLVYQTHLVMGQIEEAVSNFAGAEERYRAAKEVLEALRGELYGDELKISFLENKLEVYESLVDLCLVRGATPEATKEAWGCMELAKSRGLLDLIVSGVNSSASDKNRETDARIRLATHREQLNWYYHRIEVEQLAQAPGASERVAELRRLAAITEKELLRLFRELPAEESDVAGAELTTPVSLEQIRETLGPGATLVEYFRARDRILAALITDNGVDIVAVTTIPRIQEPLRMLQFQLAKYRLGPDYVRRFQSALLDATQAHLRELYVELLGPIRDKLKGRHLVVVPHESLHCVPFHALIDADRYLGDSFTISYAPSASIYAQCCRRRVNNEGHSLILGVPNSQAPCIDEELRALAELLPQRKLFVGPEASERVLRVEGPHSRLIHIATHGFFRQDSPMFSGIRLGDTFLTLYDLYRLVLPADQITLSGCSTGLNFIAAGDEVVGLTRGLLFAGARSLLLSLWDVNDGSTAAFMTAFYARVFNHVDRAAALQGAMQEVRERYPHPYYWAPFILVGGVCS